MFSHFLAYATDMKNNDEHIWGFDMGKGSLGEAVRIGHDFKHVQSLIIDPEFAEIKTAASARRQMRTRKAHIAREQFLEKCLNKSGIEVLQRRKVDIVDGKWTLVSKGDIRLEKEFPSSDENICYNSIALRCKLILGEKLESWQVFKALNSAIQNRGYDKNLPWKETESTSKDNDEYSKKLDEFEQEKDELLTNLPELDKQLRAQFDYPCFFKAYKMGLWNPKHPNVVELRIDNQSQKAKGYVIPRHYVEAEFIKLVEMASLQYPKLKDKAMYLLYGISETPYASYYIQNRKEYNLKRGAESDWTALGQKIPRFDNRIVDKCKLIPRLNVCKIKKLNDVKSENDLLHYEIILALKLLNLRFFRNNKEDSLTFEEFLKAFDLAKNNKYKLTKTNTKKLLKEIGASILNEEQSEIEAPNESGRSSYSRPAMKLLKEFIFSGNSPSEFYQEKIKTITNTDSNKGIIAEDLDFIKLMNTTAWNGIFIPDVETYQYATTQNANSVEQINKIIGSQNDPIVRHRLAFFYERIKSLEKKFGVPDKIILEFVRDDFLGKKAKKDMQDAIKKRTKEKLDIAKKMDEVGFKGNKMLLKLELLQKQGGVCLYTGNPISPTDLPSLEIEHIVPRSRGGPDALYNYVLTDEKTNKQKDNKTPFEWLSSDKQRWASYVDRVRSRTNALGKKRVALLLSENAEELVEKYTALAETAWIAKLAQRIACLHFGFQFGGTTGQKRVFTVSGSTTASIRGAYDLNVILHNTVVDKNTLSQVDILKKHEDLEKKNRANKKHHALDAMCLCFAPTGINAKKVKSNQILPLDIAKEAEAYFRKYLDAIIPNEVATKKPRLEESIYAKRTIGGKECIVKKFNLVELAYKSGLKPVFDISTMQKLVNSGNKGIINPVIRNIVKDFVDTNPTEQEWVNWCNNVRIPSKNGEGTRIIRVQVFVGNPDEYKDLSKDNCGAYRKGDAHKGQIIWKSKNGKYYVAPIYTHASKQTVLEQLKQNKDFLEIAGVFRSRCLVKLEDDVYNDAGISLLPKGIYLLNTIWTNGFAVLTNANGIKKSPISVNYLMQAGMKRITMEY